LSGQSLSIEYGDEALSDMSEQRLLLPVLSFLLILLINLAMQWLLVPKLKLR